MKLMTTKPESAHRFPEFPDMRHWFDALPTWMTPFESMKLEEQMLEDTYIVRAEMPGIDPDKDADVWIAEGMLHIKAERTSEHKEDTEGTFRSEFSYGSFHRAVTLPKGVTADDVKATYKDGVLEVRLTLHQHDTTVNKVPISKI